MSGGFIDGLLYAALASDDRRAAIERLEPELADALSERLDAYEAGDRSARRAELAEIAARLSTISPDAELPERARAILAPDVEPAEAGARWLSPSAKPRPGFIASPSLRRTLRAFAKPSEPNAAERERATEQKLDATRRDALRRWAEPIANGHDLARVIGALYLGCETATRGIDAEVGGDSTSRPWRTIGRDIARAHLALGLGDRTWRG